MKTMTCAEMGGPCDAAMKADTFEGIADEGMKHLAEAHPEMAEKMKTNTPEENAAWAAETKAKFDAKPEDAAPEAAPEAPMAA